MDKSIDGSWMKCRKNTFILSLAKKKLNLGFGLYVEIKIE